MNGCDRVRPLLSAFVDGELTANETPEVEAHLQSCDTCRREWESIVDVDHQLASALIVNDVDRKCAAIVQRTELPTRRIEKRRQLWNFGTIVVAVAATLLLALVPTLFFEKQAPPVAESDLVFVARLVRATGAVQCLSPGATDWTMVTPSSTESFVAGSRLKTSEDVLCEVQTSTKGLIRLNGSAEIVLRDPNQVELVAGELWCLAPESTSIDVDIPVTNVQTAQVATVVCPSSSELQCIAGNNFASCNSVSLDNSQVKMTMGTFTCPVAPGETVSIDREQNIDRRQSSDSTTKIWQLPLLAIGTSVDRELVLLLDRLLAPIGMTKARHIDESQIRQLGPSGAIPLLAYVVTESSAEHLPLRQTAIRLASDLADERAVRFLTTLTSDSDAYIASIAKETLDRIVATSK